MPDMPGLDSLLDGPPRHLERFAPPWVTDRRTICGRRLDDVAAFVTYDEGQQLVKRLGQNRVRLLLCQSCVGAQHALKTPTAWDTNPAQVVHDWTRHHWTASPAYAQTRAELLAIAQTIAAHADEFQARVQAHLTDELATRRKAPR